ncbi:MAG: hypothetical protein ACKOYN_08430 [Planctomycetota bacterium]
MAATPVAFAADDAERPATAAQPAQAPAAEALVGAFMRARAWLDADAMPALEAAGSQAAIEGAAAVCCVLRLDGRVVGVGTDDAGDALMVRRALGRAVARALGDETIRAVRDAAGDRVTVRLSLELEAAGPLRPLIGRTIDEAARRIDRGAEGVAVRRGDAVFRTYPARMSATDAAGSPARAIAALLVDAGLPAKDLPEFSRDDRVSLARFASTRLRQRDPESEPVEVTRAGRTVRNDEASAAAARTTALLLASRLAAQVVARDAARPDAGRALLGAYNPTSDEFDPPFAGARDEALAAYALAEASRSAHLPEPTRRIARAAASALAGSPERAEADAAVRLLRALALRLADDGTLAAIAEQAARQALAEQDAGAAELQALRAALLAASPAGADRADAAARLAVLVARGDLRANDLAECLPWIACAVRLAPEASSIAASEPLARVCDALRNASRADGPDDLRGGLALSVGAAPDAQCLRFLGPLIALGAPDAAFTRAALRFAMQHAAQSPWTDGFRNPSRLTGLVRESLWSDDCPPAATAAALLVALRAAEVLHGGETPQNAENGASRNIAVPADGAVPSVEVP